MSLSETQFLDAHTNYISYADFGEPGKESRAATFATAARILLGFPELMTHGQETFRMNHAEIRRQLEKAEKIQAVDTASGQSSGRWAVSRYCGE